MQKLSAFLMVSEKQLMVSLSMLSGVAVLVARAANKKIFSPDTVLSTQDFE